MLYQNKFRIESARLKEWDYSNPWWYYVTINAKSDSCFFGDIVVNGKMILTKLGLIAEKYWTEIPKHYQNVEIDYYVVMPNHVHGIIIINESRDVACNVSTNKFSQISPKKNSLSAVIRSYKSAVTKVAHENVYIDFVWQERFYDRIIRNEKELLNIRKYIQQNPMKWELEKSKSENL